MKPSATQIFRSASPPTWFPLLGSCIFIGFLSWALFPMHSDVDFKVDWPKLLFKSRLQIPCRDIDLTSRHQSCLCSFKLMSSDVATSISCRDITLCLCRFQLVSSDVATSAQVFCSLQLVVHDVATSISCRDISLCLCSLHWLFLVSRLQSSVVTKA